MGIDMDTHEHIPGSTADILHRFNQAFLRHDPALLVDLIAPDCVIERSQPTADGTHLVGVPPASLRGRPLRPITTACSRWKTWW